MNEVPVICEHCSKENMVDYENLIRREIDKIKASLGFICEGCNKYVHVLYTTISLDKALNRLNNRNTDSKHYMFRFARTMQKAEGLQDKYG